MEALSSALLMPATCATRPSLPCLSFRRSSLPSVFPCAVKHGSLSKGSRRIAGFLQFRSYSTRAALQEVDATKVIPQANRVFVRLEELPEKSVGGVLLPKSAVKFEHYLCGEILSVGKEAGAVSVGQKVLFSDVNAYEVNLGTNDKLCFVQAGDLLAVVE